MNANRPETHWPGPQPSDDRARAHGLAAMGRFHWADHQLMLHLIAGALVTLMLVLTTLMMTKH